MLHLNTRSIVNKFDSFTQLIKSLNIPLDIIGVTETWLNDSNQDLFRLKNYNFINVNHSNKNGGGVGVYVKEGIKYKLRADININLETALNRFL